MGMRKIALLGNGQVLIRLLEFLKEKEEIDKIIIGYSSRHGCEEIVEGKTYEEYLKSEENKTTKIEVVKMDNLDGNGWERVCKSDIQISLGSPWIFREKHIKMAPMLVHSHSTDLPRYRGGASMSWMIMSRQRGSAITLFKMNEGIDAGELIIKEKFMFPSNLRTPKDYMDYTNEKLTNTLKTFINKRLRSKMSRELKLKEQNEKESSYFPRLSTKIHGWIDWNWDGEDIESFVNAFSDPYDGAKTRITRNENMIIYLKKVSCIKNRERFHPFISGIIYRKYENKLYVACREKTIIVEKYKIEYDDKKTSILLGDRLYCTKEDLERATKTRIFFKP